MRICSVEECGKKHEGFGFCNKHYKKFKKDNPNTKREIKFCLVDRCLRKYKGRGYCEMHLDRFKNRGTTDKTERKNKVNENFFETFARESAYFLGWLASDGYIDEKHGNISISITDLDILEKLREIILYDGKITQRLKINSKPLYRLRIYSRKLVNDCVNLGLRQNKSLTITIPKIQDEYFWHFLRGEIDGDGSSIIRKRDGRIEFILYICSGSKNFIEGLQAKIPFKSHISFELKIDKTNPVYRLNFYGRNALALCNKLYENCEDLKLERKYQKYLEYKKYRELKDDDNTNI